MPTSRATRVTSEANELSWSTIVLMVFFSSRISPFTSTVIFLDRSPLATAVVTSAMLRTWAGEVAGHRVHGVGQVLPGAGHALHLRLAAELAFGADLAGHARHFRGERAELVHHRVDRLGRCGGTRPSAAGRRCRAPWSATGRPWPPRRSRGPPRWSAGPGRRSGCSPSSTDAAQEPPAPASAARWAIRPSLPTARLTRSSSCAISSFSSTISFSVSAILPATPVLATAHAHREVALPDGGEDGEQLSRSRVSARPRGCDVEGVRFAGRPLPVVGRSAWVLRRRKWHGSRVGTVDTIDQASA